MRYSAVVITDPLFQNNTLGYHGVGPIPVLGLVRVRTRYDLPRFDGVLARMLSP